MLRLCWIDMYVVPPDLRITDAGSNFVSEEFVKYALSISIETKSVPIETNWSIEIVERHLYILRRAYEIVMHELKEIGIRKEMTLQMTVKAVNDSSRPDVLVRLFWFLERILG